MDFETREKIREKARRRAYTCTKCGSTQLEEVDGSKCGGLAGITYKNCRSCGHAVAKTKRQKKFTL